MMSKKKTNHGPYIRHEIPFRCLKTKVDRFCVFANEYTATGVVSSGEKEIICVSSGCHSNETVPRHGSSSYIIQGLLLSFLSSRD
jgi:hypothetical protein